MSLFAMADLHLPLSVDKPMDIFGPKWQDYVRKIKKNWCAVVTPEDTVIVPGDVSWSMSLNDSLNDFQFIDELPGKKLIGKGNHDYWWATMSKNRAFVKEQGFDTIDFLFNNAYKVENFIICGTRGWYVDEKAQGSNSGADYEKIVLREAARLKIGLDEAVKLRGDGNEEILVFFHFPPIFNSFVCDEIVEVLLSYGIKRCYFGHIHGVYNIPRSINYRGINFSIISADYLDFVPMIIV
ncbi:MAG: metallophosphoesterase [Eubacteriales bacterium]